MCLRCLAGDIYGRRATLFHHLTLQSNGPTDGEAWQAYSFLLYSAAHSSAVLNCTVQFTTCYVVPADGTRNEASRRSMEKWPERAMSTLGFGRRSGPDKTSNTSYCRRALQ